ncbi:hypothetical protein [Maribellus sp. YY47]|uniref:hypothetical protein n=1 Tax=Maribellus sp. YY47 TaxID=2929486 RepID=UPI002000CE91|nr:hypothetical protein [Maribellus sp. YY47]MCK3683976.1 hypothetical protein [Maribellus sp. YY47]
MSNLLFIKTKTNTKDGDILFTGPYSMIAPYLIEIAWILANEFGEIIQENNFILDKSNDTNIFVNKSISEKTSWSLKTILVELNKVILNTDCLIYQDFIVERIIETESLRNDVRFILPSKNRINLRDIREYLLDESQFLATISISDLYFRLFAENARTKKNGAHKDVWLLYRCFFAMIKRKIIMYPREKNNCLNINKLITTRNNKLFRRVNNKISLEYDYAGFWHSKLSGKKATIYCDKDKFKESFFSKELLEIELKLKGLMTVSTIYKKNEIQNKNIQEETNKITRLINSIINLYKQARLYNEYTIMGYPKEDFIGFKGNLIDEYQGEYTLQNYYFEQIPYFTGDEVFFQAFDSEWIYDGLCQYLRILNPRTKISNSYFKHFRNRIKSDDAYSEICNELDNIYLAGNFIYDNTLEIHLKKVLKLINIEDIWIGYDNGIHFPKNGFFIGKPFRSYLSEEECLY